MNDGYYVSLLHVQSVLGNLSVGSLVKPGDAIATVGDSGYPAYATGCHLHFEVDQTSTLGDNGGYDVDPTRWLSSSDCLGIGIVGYGPRTAGAASALSNHNHVFVHGLDASLYHFSSANNMWTCFGGFMKGTPAPVVYQGVIWLFLRWADDSVRFATYYEGMRSCCT